MRASAVVNCQLTVRVAALRAFSHALIAAAWNRRRRSGELPAGRRAWSCTGAGAFCRDSAPSPAPPPQTGGGPVQWWPCPHAATWRSPCRSGQRFISRQQDLRVFEPPHIRLSLRENLQQLLAFLGFQRDSIFLHLKAPASDRCVVHLAGKPYIFRPSSQAGQNTRTGYEL